MSTTGTPAAKQTFLERVLDFLQGGDNKKITRFHAKALGVWKDNIDIAKREIEDSREKIEDLNEALVEASINIDVERIKDVDGLGSYIESYTQKLNSIQAKVVLEEAKIKAAEDNISRYEVFVALLK